MIGTPTDPGIMVRVMNDLFIHSVSQGKLHSHDDHNCIHDLLPC